MKKRTIQFAIIAGLTLAISSHVHAQGIFDDGGADSNWTTGANWDDGNVPSGINVNIGDGAITGVTADFDAGTSTVGDLRVGVNGGSGALNIAAGTLTSTGWAFVGADNTAPTTAELNLSGTGSLVTPQRFYSGLNGGTTSSRVNVSDSASLVSDVSVFGSNAGNTGVVNQSGGVVSSNQWTTVGEGGGADSTYNLSGGQFTAGSDLTVGQADANTQGTFNVTGGTGTVGANLFVGRGEFGGGGATGDLNLTGSAGTFSVLGNATFGSTAATDAIGNLNFVADSGGVTTLDVSGFLTLNDGSGVGSSNLTVDLTADSAFSTFGTSGTLTEYLLVDNLNNATTGNFAGLTEGATVNIGGGQTGTISYFGGDGNDVVLNIFVTAVPEPSAVIFTSLGLIGLVVRRRRS